MDIPNGAVGIVLATLTICLTVFGAARKYGSDEMTQQNLTKSMTALGAQLDSLGVVVSNLSEGVAKNTVITEGLKVTLVGLDGSNGLNSQVKQLARDVASLMRHGIAPETQTSSN